MLWVTGSEQINSLKLNVNKTTYMIFKHNQHINVESSVLQIGGNTIERVQCTKFLGLYTVDKLQWTNHIKHCKAKISNSLYAIRSAKHGDRLQKHLLTHYKFYKRKLLELSQTHIVLWSHRPPLQEIKYIDLQWYA